MPARTRLVTVQENASALRNRGDLAGARAMLEDAVEVASTAYGADHPDVLDAARRLAGWHREAGDLAGARRTLEVVQVAGNLTLGPADPRMLLLAHDLGQVADELGNRHEARRNFETVADLGPDVLGTTHPAVQAAARYLGTAPQAQAPPPPMLTPAPPPQAPPPQAPPPQAPPPQAPPPLAPPPQTPPQAPPKPAPPPIPLPRMSQPPTTALPAPQAPQAPPSVPPSRGAAPPDEPRIAPVPKGAVQQKPRSRRTPVLWAFVVTALAVAAAVTTAAIVFRPHEAPPAGPAPTATAASSTLQARPAPAAVRLTDDGDSITLTWQDPSAGTVPFIVAGSRAGEQSRTFAQLPAGRTSYTVNGLNPRLQYCFTVVAVYSTENFAVSDLVCTRRSSSPQPTRSR